MEAMLPMMNEMELADVESLWIQQMMKESESRAPTTSSTRSSTYPEENASDQKLHVPAVVKSKKRQRSESVESAGSESEPSMTAATPEFVNVNADKQARTETETTLTKPTKQNLQINEIDDTMPMDLNLADVESLWMKQMVQEIQGTHIEENGGGHKLPVCKSKNPQPSHRVQPDLKKKKSAGETINIVNEIDDTMPMDLYLADVESLWMKQMVQEIQGTHKEENGSGQKLPVCKSMKPKPSNEKSVQPAPKLADVESLWIKQTVQEIQGTHKEENGSGQEPPVCKSKKPQPSNEKSVQPEPAPKKRKSATETIINIGSGSQHSTAVVTVTPEISNAHSSGVIHVCTDPKPTPKQNTCTWDRNYDVLCRYVQAERDKDKNGNWNGNVTRSYETDDEPPIKLGRWTDRQRVAYRTHRLSEERVNKLEKIGFRWNMKKTREKEQVRNAELQLLNSLLDNNDKWDVMYGAL